MAEPTTVRSMLDGAITKDSSDNIALRVCNLDGSNVAADHKVAASSTDTAADYLDGKVAKSIVVTSNKLELSGDSASPGNSYYYGTSSAGTKGYNNLFSDIYTKEEINNLVEDSSIDYYLFKDAEGVIANYYNMLRALDGTAETSMANSGAYANGDQLRDVATAKSWITASGQPTYPELRAGVYDLHYHAKVSATSGAKAITLSWKLYVRASGGTETLLITSESGGALTTTQAAYATHGTLTTDYTFTTGDRLVLKVYVGVAGTGTDPTVTFYMEGNNATRLSVRASSSFAGIKADHIENFPAGSFFYIGDGGELDRDTGANGYIWRNLFAVGEEVQLRNIILPTDLRGAGTVTFEAYGYATTAAAGKVVELQVSHSPIASTEVWDAAYGTSDSGDVAITNTQDTLDKVSWTATVASLGWSAGDTVRLKLGRITPAGTDLSGDFGIVSFAIKIPRI